MEWTYSKNKDAIVLEKPTRARKKVTATRLASVLGLNEWSTPFQMWCEINKLPCPPFEGNKYTEAGNVIEPKIIQHVRDRIFDLDGENVQDPIEYWGNIYSDMKYDFFPSKKIFGGMWDAVHLDENKCIDTIIECKTSGRPQDWLNGVPTHYLVQGLMYAYLTHAKQVIFPVAFLKDEDYAHPENYVCTEENTHIYIINDPMNYKVIWVDGSDYTIEELMYIAEQWYETYIETGVSPFFDEKKDVEYLKLIRMTKPSEDSTLDEMIENYNNLEKELERIKLENNVDEMEKQIKALKEDIKKELQNQMGDLDDKIEYKTVSLSKVGKTSINTQKLKDDGLYEEYSQVTYSYTLRNLKIEE